MAVVPAFGGSRELTQKSPREKFLPFQFSPTPSDCIKEDSGSCWFLFSWMEKGMAAHSNILAWRIPWTAEPGGLQATGSQRVGPRD